MDIRKIKKLIDLIQESDIAEIEIHEGEESVRLSQTSSAAPTAMPAPPVAAAPIATAPAAVTAPATVTAPAAKNTQNTIKSPMVGTFYRSSSPENPAFVEVRSNGSSGRCCLHYRSDENV